MTNLIRPEPTGKKDESNIVAFDVAAYGLCAIESLRRTLSPSQQIFYNQRLRQEFYSFASSKTNSVDYDAVSDSMVAQKYADLGEEERLAQLLVIHRNVICHPPIKESERDVPEDYDPSLHHSVQHAFLQNKNKIFLVPKHEEFIRNKHDMLLEVESSNVMVSMWHRLFGRKLPVPKCNKTALHNIEASVQYFFTLSDPYAQLIDMKNNQDVASWIENANLAYDGLIANTQSSLDIIWKERVGPKMATLPAKAAVA